MMCDLFHSNPARCLRDQRRDTREMTYSGNAFSNTIRDCVTGAVTNKRQYRWIRRSSLENNIGLWITVYSRQDK